MILPRPIQDNPLIVRAFRTGFRRGPNSFRISVWGGGLALLVAAATFPAIVFSGISYESAASWLLAGLAVYTVATFVIGGLQRMLMSFLSERERGTFDFIHLSTLRPSSIVLGYLLAGQLLGYLLLCLTIPVMLVSASIADYGLPSIVLLILAIVGYAVMLSMIFLTAGFWSEKISDLKGSALVLLSLLLIALTFLARIPATSWGQAGTLQLFGILPVLNSLWEQAEGAAPRTLVFFGRDLPLLLLALITFVPLTGLLFHSLCRSIRYRDRRPVADGHALLTVLWVHFLFTGFYWGGGVTVERKVIVLALISWAGMRWLLARSVRARETTLRRLSDLGGNPLQLLKDGLGPPYRLLVLLLVELAVVAFLQGVGPRSAEGGGGGAVIILLLLGPFVALCLFEQLLAWESRGPQRRGWARASSFLIVWLPLLLYSILGSLGRSFPGFPGEGLWYLALISPFSQMALLGGISTTEVQGSAAIGVAIPQGAALVAVVSLSLLHMRILRAFGSSARKLRAATMATTTEKEAAAEGERGEGARFASDSTAAERGDA